MSVVKHNPEETARIGRDVFARTIRPRLATEDDGKFVAIDILSGDYELDPDDYSAVMRLRQRRPSAEIWLERAGYPAAHKMMRHSA